MGTWVVLALAGGAGLVAWALALALLAVATRPRNGAPGAETMELGDESPALVNLLVNRAQLQRAAVPATLLDLAGRRVVAIEQVGLGQYVCRFKVHGPAADGDRNGGHDSDRDRLTGYERQVLEHVEGLADDGVVPCEALSTGPEDDSIRWWRRFEKAVTAEARQRGLVRPRWTPITHVVLGAVAVAPALCIALLSASIPGDSSEGGEHPLIVAVGIGLMVWTGLMAVPQRLRSLRLTDAGLEASGRWLGVQAHLHHDPIFPTLPPAAVAVWDRYLGYGAALGVSVDAVRALPLGTESDTEAWSSVGGRWRLVTVSYPRRLPPGWGRHPLLTVLAGLAQAVILGAILVGFGPMAVRAIWERGTDPNGSLPEAFPFETVFPIAVGAIAAVLGIVLLRALVMLVLAVPDLWARRSVEGRVLRVRHHEDGPTWVAVDDGTGAHIRAWAVPGGRLPVQQGNVVRAEASRYLGWVWAIEQLPRTSAANEAATN